MGVYTSRKWDYSFFIPTETDDRAMDISSTDTSYALVPLTAARSHATPATRRQGQVRQAYGNGAGASSATSTPTGADRVTLRQPARQRSAAASRSETPTSRAAVRSFYGNQGTPTSFMPPGSLINIRV